MTLIKKNLKRRNRKEYLKDQQTQNIIENGEQNPESKRKWREIQESKKMNRRGSLKWSRANPEKNSQEVENGK